jgi:hypothetical protein
LFSFSTLLFSFLSPVNRTCGCKHSTVECLAQRHHPGLVIRNDVRKLNVALRRIDEIPLGVIDAGLLRLWWNVSDSF